jgi:sulfide:quinone oxidoreductase
MDIRDVNDKLSVAPQIAPADVAAIAQMGFSDIVCNRPDGEEPGQPSVQAIATEAKAHGLAFHHLPITGGHFPEETIEQTRTIRQQASGRVLAYCRSGTRSITLDSIANPDGRDADERMAQAEAAGYDLSGVRPLL